MSCKDKEDYDETFLRDQNLVTLVEGFPHLYDKSFNSSKNSLKKENSWRIIARAMQMSVQDVQFRFRLLRDKYVRQKKTLNSLSEEEVYIEERWPLFESLKFLDGHIRKSRKSYQNTEDGKPADETIISLVREYPQLYDNSLPDYKSSKKREKAWRVIAEKVQMSVDEVQYRFRVIRDRYVKEKKKVAEPVTGCQATPEERWPLFSSLSFLDRHIKNKRVGRFTVAPVQPIMIKVITHDGVPDQSKKMELITPDNISGRMASFVSPSADDLEDACSTALEPDIVIKTEPSSVIESVKTDKFELPPEVSICDEAEMPVVTCMCESRGVDEILPSVTFQNKRKKSDSEDDMVITVKKKSGGGESSTEDNEDSLFCRSLVPMLQRIRNNRKKGRLKSRILSLVADAEEG